MWRKPLITTLLLAALLPNGYSFAADSAPPVPPTSVGPTSDQEAKLLWDSGRADMEAGKFQDAINSLSRLVERYPGHPGFLDAHVLLGRAYLEVGRPRDATRVLKYYVSAAGVTQASAQARLWLGMSYNASQRSQEAYLTAVEIENMKIKLPADIQAEALILKSEALMGLNRDSRASKALDNAQKIIKEEGVMPSLKGRAEWSALRLKTRACAQLPSPGQLSENQLREQLDRRGTCLLESMVIYKNTLEANDTRWAKEAQSTLDAALWDYSKACANPLNSRTMPKGKRSSKQLSRYKAELTEILLQDCHQKFVSAQDLLTTWKPKFPQSMAGNIEQVSQSLNRLVARIK